MADVEEPQLTTLAERIAALNKQKNFQAPPPGAGKRPPPPPPPTIQRNGTAPAAAKSPSLPPRPGSNAAAVEGKAPPLPRRTTATVDEDKTSTSLQRRSLAPPPPPRSSTEQISPSLSSRRSSTQTFHGRRGSDSSDISLLSTVSSLSLNQVPSAADQGGRRLPPTLDQAKLPPLPPTRRELEAKAKEAAEQEVARLRLHPARSESAVSRIADPPTLPSRPQCSPGVNPTAQEQGPCLPARRLPPPPAQWNSRSNSAFDATVPPAHPRPDTPPPVPVSSRPTIAQIDAVTTRAAG